MQVRNITILFIHFFHHRINNAIWRSVTSHIWLHSKFYSRAAKNCRFAWRNLALSSARWYRKPASIYWNVEMKFINSWKLRGVDSCSTNGLRYMRSRAVQHRHLQNIYIFVWAEAHAPFQRLLVSLHQWSTNLLIFASIYNWLMTWIVIVNISVCTKFQIRCTLLWCRRIWRKVRSISFRFASAAFFPTIFSYFNFFSIYKRARGTFVWPT